MEGGKNSVGGGDGGGGKSGECVAGGSKGGEGGEEGNAQMMEGSADCYYENVNVWLEDQNFVGLRSIVDDPGDAHEVWCEDELERYPCPPFGRSSKTLRCNSSSSQADAMQSSTFVTSNHDWQVAERYVHAQTAGPPPRRTQYHSDAKFRTARSRWYLSFTGKVLDQSGSLAEQQSAFDAVARSWRAYSDGRRSLSASQWDGRLTAAERRMNEMVI